jgi:hypothetical protein
MERFQYSFVVLSLWDILSDERVGLLLVKNSYYLQLDIYNVCPVLVIVNSIYLDKP